MKSPCVSLTGATGFLGRHITSALAAAGWHTRAVVRRGGSAHVPPGSAVREASLHDRADLARAFEGTDVIVHAAGLVRARSGRTLDWVNVEGTRAVVEAANAVGARLVHVSSLAAIGPGTVERPARERDVPHPVNAYGRSKLAAEGEVIARARVPWIILRPCAVYGPGDRGFLPLVRMARRGWFPLATRPTMPFSFVYAADLAQAVRRAVEHDASGHAVFVGHDSTETTESMLRGIAAAVGTQYRPWRVPRACLRALAGLGDVLWVCGGRPVVDSSRYAELTAEGFVCDVKAARDLLGFTAAVSLPEGLARTVRWYQEQGWV